MTITQERLTIRGASCDLLRAGFGDELVVFLHAVGGDHTSWTAQLEAAPARYTAISLSFRGHGPRSGDGVLMPPRESIHVGEFASDVCELIERLGFESAHLVGLSMGGVVAQLVHRQRPDLVASLTLASTWAHYGEEAARARNDYLKDRLARLPMLEGSRQDMAFLLAPGTPPEQIEAAAQIEGNKDSDAFVRSWESMFEVDLRDDLLGLTAPLLLIGSPSDPIAPPTPYLDAIARAVPCAKRVTMERAGHFSNLDCPAEFNRAVYGFLAQHGGRSRRRYSPSAEPVSVAADTTAQALIHLLSARGVDVLFSNSGTDYVEVIDALARYEGTPGFAMRVVAAPHENTVIAMAHGYYLATGRVQAVMGHVNVGSANMTLGVINAYRSRIPILVMAGRTPHYDDGLPGSRVNFVQWGQDTRDQASFREFLKWDYELRGPHALETVVDRALAIAQSDPAGPVYLMLPGEVMASALPGAEAEAESFDYAPTPRQRPARAGVADQAAILRAARAIAKAQRPLVITAELGRYEGGPRALARLAERFALPVVEFGKHNFMNLPTSHPMHLGFDPVPAVREADLIVAVECHVPYIPRFAALGRPPELIQIGVDPLCEGLPMRAFPSDISLVGDPAATLAALGRALEDEVDRALVTQRHARLAREHEALYAAAGAAADEDAALPRVTKRLLSRTLGKLLEPDALVFNEYDLDPTLVPRDEPGTWFENSIASGLGWALGAALGAKLALPERTVVATLGDGSYLFNVPISAHYVAAAERLPILIVVFNDQGWSTIKRSYKGAKPAGWAIQNDRFALCDFEVPIAYDKLAEAVGGVGLTVTSPAELEGVLREALRLVREADRHVLVNVHCLSDAG